MKLHKNKRKFNELITIVSDDMHISESAVKRDYFMVLMLNNLALSEYKDLCVFKGGTSLSKCYPGIIDRFSEDIDITYLGMDKVDNVCSREIKKIESIMTDGLNFEIIPEERFKRSKSLYAWFDDENDKIKLEIGSNVKPDPYSKKTLKSYIHQYLEKNMFKDDILKYELKSVELNVLNIERTFIDKILAVKRHAFNDKIQNKVRHIYDVVKLYKTEEIQKFLKNKDELKRIIEITKKTDAYYVEKRKNEITYNAIQKYDFDSWKHLLNHNVKSIYERLHNTLLYTDTKQSFSEALDVFSQINNIFNEINE